MRISDETLALRLKSARKASGLSQPDVAQALGVKEFQTVSKWERAVNRPEDENLEKLANLYKKPLAFFLFEDGVASTPRPPEDLTDAYKEIIAIISELKPGAIHDALDALREIANPRTPVTDRDKLLASLAHVDDEAIATIAGMISPILANSKKSRNSI